jgi:hypothetical protein
MVVSHNPHTMILNSIVFITAKGYNIHINFMAVHVMIVYLIIWHQHNL